MFCFIHVRLGEIATDFLGEIAAGLTRRGPSGPGLPPPPTGGCPPGTRWRGFPWRSNVCDPVGVVPGDPFAPTEGGGVQCIWPWTRDPITGQCVLKAGDVAGPDPTPSNGFQPGVAGSRIHGEFFHTDHPPQRVEVSVRRCGRGSVLGKDGWCHPKGSIPNKERLYPRGTRPLGSPREMKAITVAGQFARRLKTKKKTLKKLSTALGSC